MSGYTCILFVLWPFCMFLGNFLFRIVLSDFQLLFVICNFCFSCIHFIVSSGIFSFSTVRFCLSSGSLFCCLF